MSLVLPKFQMRISQETQISNSRLTLIFCKCKYKYISDGVEVAHQAFKEYKEVFVVCCVSEPRRPAGWWGIVPAGHNKQAEWPWEEDRCGSGGASGSWRTSSSRIINTFISQTIKGKLCWLWYVEGSSYKELKWRVWCWRTVNLLNTKMRIAAYFSACKEPPLVSMVNIAATLLRTGS